MVSFFVCKHSVPTFTNALGYVKLVSQHFCRVGIHKKAIAFFSNQVVKAVLLFEGTGALTMVTSIMVLPFIISQSSHKRHVV